MDHKLKSDGAPHDATNGRAINEDKSTSGRGAALCSCGWLSENLDSGNARRKAHKEHKAEEARLEAESVPVKPFASEPPPEPESETVHFTVSYAGCSKPFWRTFGRTGGKRIAAFFGASVVSVSNQDMVLELEGSDPAHVADVLQRMWREGNERFTAWKREDSEYKRLRKAGGKEWLRMERQFFTDFVLGVEEAVTGLSEKPENTVAHSAGYAWAQSL